MWLLILLSVHKILPIHIKMYPVLKVHLKYLVHNVFPEIPFQLIFPSAEVLQSVLCNSLMVCISLSLFFPHTSTFSLQLLGYICLKGIFFGDLCRYIFSRWGDKPRLIRYTCSFLWEKCCWSDFLQWKGSAWEITAPQSNLGATLGQYPYRFWIMES